MLRRYPWSLYFSDDIPVNGKTPEDHHTSLQAVFERLQIHGLTLNKDKCLVYQTKLTFLVLYFLLTVFHLALRQLLRLKMHHYPVLPMMFVLSLEW